MNLKFFILLFNFFAHGTLPELFGILAFSLAFVGASHLFNVARYSAIATRFPLDGAECTRLSAVH